MHVPLSPKPKALDVCWCLGQRMAEMLEKWVLTVATLGFQPGPKVRSTAMEIWVDRSG